MLQSFKRTLLNWSAEGFADVTFERHGFSHTIFLGSSTIRYFPSLKQPDHCWFTFQSEGQSFLWSTITFTLKTSQDAVVMLSKRNAIGVETSREVRINNGPPTIFEENGDDWLLKNDKGAILARWQKGSLYNKLPLSEEALAMGNPEGKHSYDKVFVNSDVLAEMIIPNGASTTARFIHQPPAPLMKNVSETLTKEQTGILLSCLMLQIRQIP